MSRRAAGSRRPPPGRAGSALRPVGVLGWAAAARGVASALAALAAAGCGSKGPAPAAAPPPPPGGAAIVSFVASPDVIAPGGQAVLRWAVANAASLTLTSNPPAAVPALQLTDTSLSVAPAQDTTYTLSVQGQDGTSSASRTLSVIVAPPPSVTLQAAAASVARGAGLQLRWSATFAQDYTLLSTPQGGSAAATHVGTALGARVRPLADTSYVVQALGPGGSSTSNAVAVSVIGGPAAALAYQAPTPGATDVVQLVADPASTPSLLVLDVQAVVPFSASAFALDLPLDGGGAAGSRDGSARVALDPSTAAPPAGLVAIGPGLDASARLIPAGSSPYSAAAALPAAGRLAGVLTVGVARKPACAAPLACAGGASGDLAFAAGEVLARIRLQLQPAGGAGPVFAATDLTTAHGYRALVRTAAGGSAGTVAVGALQAN